MKEVTILHLGEGWQDCPFDTETWVCNTQYRKVKRVDKLFLMHKQVFRKIPIIVTIDGDTDEYPVYDWDEINRISKERNFEVLARHNIPGLEASRYPYQEIVKHFKTKYFTCSACYMIAFAMFRGYERIHFWGVNFLEDVSDITDDFYERLGVEYWIGRANQAGIETNIHTGNLLVTRTGKPYAIDG